MAIATTEQRSALGSRRGVLVLLLLCAVQFLDIVDSSIMNVALPSIRRDLGFSQQDVQWVLSGYLLTYGGLLLLGGRMADLFGRRRMLVAGTMLFAVSSLAGAAAGGAAVLVGARLAQGVGAALMAPAGLSILTTTFTEDHDRHRALGVWGAVSGLAAAAGVFLGGVLTEGPGWRWVLLVNVPVCVLIVVAAFGLLAGQRERPRVRNTDVRGAVLATGGMLLLIYALVRAPEVGWDSAHTIGELATAGLLLVAFAGNEARHRNPLFPFGILRIKGLAAANAAQLIAFAGFVSTFFFLTLYMQNALGWSPIRAGSAYLPVTAGIAVAAGVTSKLYGRVGARPIIVTGSLLAAAGIAYLARVPLPASYLGDLLPGLAIMSVGVGAVFVTVTTAANASVPADQSGLAAGLLNTSQQLGSALGLAIFSALATARTNERLAAQTPPVEAMTTGFHRALLAASAAVLAAALIALRTAGRKQP